MAKLTDKYLLDLATGLTQDFIQHWDTLYLGEFRDYRRMAAGALPQKLATELERDLYKRRSKLIPRLVPDAISTVKGTIQHNLFHREDTFQLTGEGEEDHRKSEKAEQVVKYGWRTTNTETVCGEILDDTLEVGLGYGETEHWKKTHRTKRPMPVFNKLTYNSTETIYDGPRLKRFRTELVYPEPVTRFEDMTAYARLVTVPISTLRREAQKGGLHYKYRENVGLLKAQCAGEDPNLKYNIDKLKNTQWGNNNTRIPDYKVLVCVVWVRIAESDYAVPEWRRIIIGNYDQDPKIIGNDIDPLDSGECPLVVCRAFPRNDRFAGSSVPEMVYGLLLEKWAKRNQRIDYANQMIMLAGMLIMPPNSIKKNPILAEMNKIIELQGSYTADSIKSITMDSRPITTSLNEEAVIDNDVRRTLNTNEISSGYSPSRREAATTNAIIDENSKLQQSTPIKAVEDSLVIPVVRAYLQDFQNFSDPSFIIRITGERGQILFMNMEKSAILGNFDIKCRASSEVIPRALKQQMYTQFVNQYAANPKVNVDWNLIAKEHLKSMELGSIADIAIKDMETEMQNIQREESMMINGVVYEARPYEPHDLHLVSHLQTRKKIEEGSSAAIAFDSHIMEHQQMMAQINGQMNLPNGSSATTIGENLDNNMAQSAPKVLG